jgi:hypothetical protein
MPKSDVSLDFVCPICGALHQEKCNLISGALCFESHVEINQRAIRRSKMRNVNRVFRTIVIASAVALVSIAVHGTTIRLTADLKASAEVPPKDSAGTGTVTATLDTETNEFKYHVEFRGLTGPVVAAHFHGPAVAGANAKPQLPITTTPITGPIDGKAILTPEQAKDLVDGNWYFNLHTSANPGGEIRGQILKSE